MLATVTANNCQFSNTNHLNTIRSFSSIEVPYDNECVTINSCNVQLTLLLKPRSSFPVPWVEFKNRFRITVWPDDIKNPWVKMFTWINSKPHKKCIFVMLSLLVLLCLFLSDKWCLFTPSLHGYSLTLGQIHERCTANVYPTHFTKTLHRRHDISNHQRITCLLNSLFSIPMSWLHRGIWIKQAEKDKNSLTICIIIEIYCMNICKSI